MELDAISDDVKYLILWAVVIVTPIVIGAFLAIRDMNREREDWQ